MCLVISFTAPETTRTALEQVATALASEEVRLKVDSSTQRQPCGKSTVTGSLSEGSGCACGLLHDEADWNAPFWVLRTERVTALVQTVETLCHAVPEGLVIEALWTGEKADQDQVVSPEHLLITIRLGKLGTHTRYVVQSEAPMQFVG